MRLKTSAQVLVLGALTIALLDGLDAVIFWRLRGVGAARVFQGIAAGLLGRASFGGGAATVALGVAIHTLIAATVMMTFYAAALRRPALVRRPFLSGPAYGVIVYLVMSQIVIPLSAIGTRPGALAAVVNGLVIHALGVGLPAALFTRAAIARGALARRDPRSGAINVPRTGTRSAPPLR